MIRRLITLARFEPAIALTMGMITVGAAACVYIILWWKP
jgi:hypothetical protein